VVVNTGKAAVFVAVTAAVVVTGLVVVGNTGPVVVNTIVPVVVDIDVEAVLLIGALLLVSVLISVVDAVEERVVTEEEVSV
jgi:hypothetical protein